MTSPPSHEEFPESSGILLMWEMLLNGLLFFKWTSKKKKGNISGGFIDSFLIQSLHLPSAAVFSLKRLPCTKSSPPCGCGWWDLFSKYCANHADLQNDLGPCTNVPQATTVFSVLLRHLFIILMAIQKMAPSTFAVIFSLQPFCPNVFCFFHSFLHPSLYNPHTRNALLFSPKCSWQLPSWPNQEWLIQHPSAPSAFDLWSSPAGLVITYILCGLYIKQLFPHQSRLPW